MGLRADRRLTLEAGPPSRPMQAFDLEAVRIETVNAVIQLGFRPAIGKPRHRAEEAVRAVAGFRQSRDGCC
ncbi:hypothetical protein [Muricoccus aerilatus]|uniref:hypothetical protein n=1 Tax=Muricoccus aerilatus TaxID=452982 RepID=UPI0005C25ABB|nr:hypothetical protein [Roseomonas aerilata]